MLWWRQHLLAVQQCLPLDIQLNLAHCCPSCSTVGIAPCCPCCTEYKDTIAGKLDIKPPRHKTPLETRNATIFKSMMTSQLHSSFFFKATCKVFFQEKNSIFWNGNVSLCEWNNSNSSAFSNFKISCHKGKVERNKSQFLFFCFKQNKQSVNTYYPG